MNAIITVVGSDKVGIIANVSSFLAEHKINIADITQTILSGNFVMMMMVNFDNSDIAIDELRNSLAKKAEDMGVEINVMSEKVFSAMHRVKKFLFIKVNFFCDSFHFFFCFYYKHIGVYIDFVL